MKVISNQTNETKEVINHLSTLELDSSYYLLILAGPHKKGKSDFMNSMSKTGRKVSDIDLQKIISKNEEESFRQIDTIFDSGSDESEILYLKNGDRLCGAYTGFTYSSVRYATPQERYFLKKLPGCEKIIVLDIEDSYNIDKSLERLTQLTIRFDKPRSFLKNLLWKAGSTVSVHGHEFPSKRH